MEYFDVTDIPEGLLRARFETHTGKQSAHLAFLYSPVMRALLELASKERKHRSCITGEYTFGKSTFAEALSQASFTYIFIRQFLQTCSTHLMGPTGEIVSHYDARAVDSVKTRSGSEIFGNEIDSHNDHVAHAKGHIVEWPEYDDDKSFNEVWEIATSVPYLERKENSVRIISLNCTDEIAEMPEFQQFLDNTEAEGLLLSRG